MENNVLQRNKRKFLELNFVKVAIILFVLHIPFLIAYFPGLMIYDTGSSIAQFYGIKTHVVEMSAIPNAVLSNHHMIILTFVFGAFIKLGELFGSQSIGFFLFILLQLCFFCCVSSYALITIKKNLTRIETVIFLLIYSLFLPISLWMITMSKDSFFSIFFLLFIVLLYRYEKSQGQALERRKYRLMIIGTCMGLTLTKQQGIYIVIICALYIMLRERKRIWKTIYTFLLPSIAYQIIIVMILLPFLNVAPSGKQEMLGFMFQQTALSVIENTESITEEEKEAIDNVLPYEKLPDIYVPDSQDNVKFQFNQMATSESVRNYVLTWFKMFFKYPGSYFKATFLNCQGFFTPNSSEFTKNSFMPIRIENSILSQHSEFNLSNPKTPVYTVIQVIVDKINATPLVSAIFRCFFYVWLGIIVCVVSIIRNKKVVYYVFPIIVTMLFFVISPVVEFRYVFPLVITEPFLTLIVLYQIRVRLVN